jgi:hypothetical protein
MVRQEVTGSIGTLDITVTLDGEDEQLANLCYGDIVGRLDEIKQIVEEDVEPSETIPPMTADWEKLDK